MLRPILGLTLTAVSRSPLRMRTPIACMRLVAASRAGIGRAHLSTSAVVRNAQSQQPQPQRKSNNPDMPSFSLDSLGVSRNMKLVIYGLFCICATIESWFYCKAAWRWWKGDGSNPEDEPKPEAAQ